MPNDQTPPPDVDAIDGALVSLEAEASTVSLLNKGEIDMQIATAHKYPRNVKGFRDEVRALATLNESVAEECSYALPRDGKTIIGPSARFAEIIGSSWGNCRFAARVVDERAGFIVAQGAFLDLQKNVAITYEVQRRITGKGGRRYSEDMIGTTANAACSIALRNAILKGIPKALWADLWEEARSVAIGDATTLNNRRANAVKKLQAYGVSEAQMLRKLGRASLDDVTPDDLGTLFGIFTALKEGDSTPEELFAEESLPVGMPQPKSETAAADIDKATGEIKTPAQQAEPTPAEAVDGKAMQQKARAMTQSSKAQRDMVVTVATKAGIAKETIDGALVDQFAFVLGDMPAEMFNNVLSFFKTLKK